MAREFLFSTFTRKGQHSLNYIVIAHNKRDAQSYMKGKGTQFQYEITSQCKMDGSIIEDVISEGAKLHYHFKVNGGNMSLLPTWAKEDKDRVPYWMRLGIDK